MIPQYCTAHPVLRIITRNWQENVMADFLLGKLAREKNGRFGKAWLGKRGGNLCQGRKRKLSESVEIVESAKTSVLSFSKCEFPVTGKRVVVPLRICGIYTYTRQCILPCQHSLVPSSIL